jgi:hypothetical protein
MLIPLAADALAAPVRAQQAPRDAPPPVEQMPIEPTHGASDVDYAARLMEGYARRSGLTGGQPAKRYLWTDAFAVCNLVGLAGATGHRHYLDLALRLVEQTHHTLGRHREDDPRSGWISALSGAEAAAHPTVGGLRIGKALPERGAGEALDQRLEWERDGQYFHYLSKWTHALDQLARTTGKAHFNAWARELAVVAHDAFTYRPADGGAPRMYWKMSIDLARPLVPTMGQHDALDGYVTSLQLRAFPGATGTDLEQAIRDFRSMLHGAELASPDPLGIGGLLADAYRVQQLLRRQAIPDDGLLGRLLEAALAGLRHYAHGGELAEPAHYRLAFRELGLSIGLHAAQRLWQESDQGRELGDARAASALAELRRYAPLAREIEAFWRQPPHQQGATWLEHRDINEVMLATSLLPEGFLVLRPVD